MDPTDARSRPDGSPASTGGTPRSRRFGATRVLPRVEVGRAPAGVDTPRAAPLTPEIVDPAPGDDDPRNVVGGPAFGGDPSFGGGGGGDPFGPRSFAGGRVRVYGCSPGCLAASLVVSLILTLLLNALF